MAWNGLTYPDANQQGLWPMENTGAYVDEDLQAALNRFFRPTWQSAPDRRGGEFVPAFQDNEPPDWEAYARQLQFPDRWDAVGGAYREDPRGIGRQVAPHIVENLKRAYDRLRQGNQQESDFRETQRLKAEANRFRDSFGNWDPRKIQAANERDAFNNSDTVQRIVNGVQMHGREVWDQPDWMKLPGMHTPEPIGYTGTGGNGESYTPFGGPEGQSVPWGDVNAMKGPRPMPVRRSRFVPIKPVDIAGGEQFEFPKPWLSNTPAAIQRANEERQAMSGNLNASLTGAYDALGTGKLKGAASEDALASIQRLKDALRKIHGMEEPYQTPKERESSKETLIKDKELQQNVVRELMNKNIPGQPPKYGDKQARQLAMIWAEDIRKLPREVLADLPANLRIQHEQPKQQMLPLPWHRPENMPGMGASWPGVVDRPEMSPAGPPPPASMLPKALGSSALEEARAAGAGVPSLADIPDIVEALTPRATYLPIAPNQPVWQGGAKPDALHELLARIWKRRPKEWPISTWPGF